MINYTDTGGGNAGTGTPVTFTSSGLATGLGNALANPYSDGGATEFFRNGIVIGDGVDVLATRPLAGAASRQPSSAPLRATATSSASLTTGPTTS